MLEFGRSIPKRIKSNDENDYWIAQLEKAIDLGFESYTAEERDSIYQVQKLIEEFEQENYPAGWFDGQVEGSDSLR